MTKFIAKKKILNLMTIHKAVIAKDPYTNDYSINLYPKKNSVSIEFYTLQDLDAAERALAPYFDWFERHELDSFKEKRYMLYAKHVGVSNASFEGIFEDQ